jgi:hypothetical protein
MSEEMIPVNEEKEEQSIILSTPPILSYDLSQYKRPEDIIAEATEAAKILKHIMMSKPKKFILDDEIYPEYEDWLTAARFYGCVPRVKWTKYTTEYGAVGFEAGCELIQIKSCNVISYAESMCLSDEPKWAGKALYALRSMAQTRAGSKVMRNVFSWILVLAGYKPTPAEEITQEMIDASKAPAQLRGIHEV